MVNLHDPDGEELLTEELREELAGTAETMASLARMEDTPMHILLANITAQMDKVTELQRRREGKG